METIAKLIKALFFDEETVNKTAVQKVRDFLLVLFIVEHLLIGCMFYFFDDDETEATTEYVEQSSED